MSMREKGRECVRFSPPFVYIASRSELLLFARYRFILMLSRCIYTAREKEDAFVCVYFA